MERKNILLVKTVSRYGSADKYVEAWASALRKLGCNTCVLDGWSLAQPMHYNHILVTKRFDAVFDLNGVLCAWGITKNLPKEIPYAVYICDPPTSGDLQDKLEMADERTIVFACDRNFCDYMDRYFLNIKHTRFVPLSGECYSVYTPYEKRSIDIIFTGTYDDPENYKRQILSRFEPGGVMRLFVGDMLEDIIENPQYTLPECLGRILEKYHQEVSDREFHELSGEFLTIDFYARFYYRDKIIRTLLDAGLKIDVYGNNWEKFEAEHKENLIIHKGGSYAAGKAVANAKIALNIMPWFKNGFQERIEAAMLSGTVAVTDESKYITENFDDNRELLIFSLKEIEKLPGRIRYLLENPKEAAEIAANGREKAQKHTWEARTYEMVKGIEEVFGISMIQEGEGRELEFELEYPDRQTLVSDAVYELHKLAAFADNDIGQTDGLSKYEMETLENRWDRFARKFSKRLTGMEMSEYVRSCLRTADEADFKHAVELFSLHCRALMGDLQLQEKGVKL